MDVRASAAMLEGMIVSSGTGDNGPAGERAVSVESSECRSGSAAAVNSSANVPIIGQHTRSQSRKFSA